MTTIRFWILALPTLALGIGVLWRGEDLRPPTESYVCRNLADASRLHVHVQQSELESFECSIDDRAVLRELAGNLQFRGAPVRSPGEKCCGCRPYYSFRLHSFPSVVAIVNHRDTLWLFTPTGLYMASIDPQFQVTLDRAARAARR